jgi:hypothetical protein
VPLDFQPSESKSAKCRVVSSSSVTALADHRPVAAFKNTYDSGATLKPGARTRVSNDTKD